MKAEISALNQVGCRHIQIDEPLFSSFPNQALSFGFGLLEYCYGQYEDLTKYLHICRNYPNVIDGVATNKARAECYEPLADRLNTCCAHIISLEDAAIQVSDSVLQTIKEKKLMLGVCSVGTRTVESVDSIIKRAEEVSSLRSNDELYLSPDCGFLYLDFETAVGKMRVINEAKKIMSN